jgi:hypothetical protein
MSMDTWTCAPGSSLLIPSGPTGLHLFVLTLGPAVLPNYGNDPKVLLVGASTVREGVPYDTACVLNDGEHSFIKHPSYIAYRYARLESVSHVNKMIETSTWHTHEECSVDLLKKIQSGIHISKYISREFRSIFA